MQLSSLLPPEAVLSHLEVRDKKTALKLLAAHAATLTNIPERDIYAVLLEREQIGCTGMGSGVCIPHGRFKELHTLHAVFARLERGIEFGSADHKPVDLIFLLLTPAEANTEHLKALAMASRRLRDKELAEAIRATNDARAIHKLLTEWHDGDDER
jgi:PTS system nitrogen regulatory IIA component